MVAFLLEVGSNQRPVSDVKRVLAAKDRTEARMTAPASGLYLVSVDYGKWLTIKGEKGILMLGISFPSNNSVHYYM